MLQHKTRAQIGCILLTLSKSDSPITAEQLAKETGLPIFAVDCRLSELAGVGAVEPHGFYHRLSPIMSAAFSGRPLTAKEYSSCVSLFFQIEALGGAR